MLIKSFVRKMMLDLSNKLLRSVEKDVDSQPQPVLIAAFDMAEQLARTGKELSFHLNQKSQTEFDQLRTYLNSLLNISAVAEKAINILEINSGLKPMPTEESTDSSPKVFVPSFVKIVDESAFSSMLEEFTQQKEQQK